MCDINPEYTHHIRLKDGRKTLYIRILEAIYGMIESAILWYELYMSILKDMGFQLNPYDIYVANIYINVKQCTTDWYFGGNKVPHVEQDVVDDVIIKVEERFPGLQSQRVMYIPYY